ncbi:MAG: hypothetical protein JWM39_893 [Parcubacteria group bacterium]|nr:hypothetical protein [Parcubacteria group bacterium]
MQFTDEKTTRFLKKWTPRVLVAASVYFLFHFLFNDYFQVDPYGNGAFGYTLCATFLTLYYLWKKRTDTK